MPMRIAAALTAGTAAVALALTGCSPGASTPPPSTPRSASPGASGTGSTSAATLPADVFTDSQLESIARAVVQSRDLRGTVREAGSLRGNLAYQGTTVDSTTTPSQCSPFRLQGPMAQELRFLDTSTSISAGMVPFAEPSATSVIGFMIRSAPRDVLATPDFEYEDGLVSECSDFERVFSVSSGAGMNPETSVVAAHLVPAPAVGEKSYATTQMAKGLGAADRGTASMQVLAGTVSLDMAVTLWPVSSESTDRATEAMAGFARDVLTQIAAAGGQQAVPPGARSSQELEDLLADFAGPGGATIYMGPSSSRVIVSLAGASPAPSQARCSYDDGAYLGALAGAATLAHGMASTAEKTDSLMDVTVISMGASIQPPYPFDTRVSAVQECGTLEAKVAEQSPATWSSVAPLAAKPAGDSSYAFQYAASDGTGRRFVRLGARRGNLTVEVSTFALWPLGQDQVPSAAERGTAIINAVFARAGL